MLDWNGSGGSDPFDSQMDYHVLNDSSSGSFGTSSGSGGKYIYFIICAAALGTLEKLIIGLEYASIFSVLLAIPLCHVVYELDRKLGKWDAKEVKEAGKSVIDENVISVVEAEIFEQLKLYRRKLTKEETILVSSVARRIAEMLIKQESIYHSSWNSNFDYREKARRELLVFLKKELPTEYSESDIEIKCRWVHDYISKETNRGRKWGKSKIFNRQ